jgi:hypothetical protein
MAENTPMLPEHAIKANGRLHAAGELLYKFCKLPDDHPDVVSLSNGGVIVKRGIPEHEVGLMTDRFVSQRSQQSEDGRTVANWEMLSHRMGRLVAEAGVRSKLVKELLSQMSKVFDNTEVPSEAAKAYDDAIAQNKISETALAEAIGLYKKASGIP